MLRYPMRWCVGYAALCGGVWATLRYAVVFGRLRDDVRRYAPRFEAMRFDTMPTVLQGW